MASDIWEVTKYIHYFELFPVCLFIFRMTCIKYKVCSQYTVYIHPPTPHPQRPFISEDEILTYISGILQKKNYTKYHRDSSTHETYIILC